MTKAVEGLADALREVIGCTSRADTGGCEHCHDVARAALEAFAQREPLRDEADADFAVALVVALDSQIPKGVVIDVRPLFDVIDEHVFGPRGAGKGEG